MYLKHVQTVRPRPRLYEPSGTRGCRTPSKLNCPRWRSQISQVAGGNGSASEAASALGRWTGTLLPAGRSRATASSEGICLNECNFARRELRLPPQDFNERPPEAGFRAGPPPERLTACSHRVGMRASDWMGDMTTTGPSQRPVASTGHPARPRGRPRSWASTDRPRRSPARGQERSPAWSHFAPGNALT